MDSLRDDEDFAAVYEHTPRSPTPVKIKTEEEQDADDAYLDSILEGHDGEEVPESIDLTAEHVPPLTPAPRPLPTSTLPGLTINLAIRPSLHSAGADRWQTQQSSAFVKKTALAPPAPAAVSQTPEVAALPSAGPPEAAALPMHGLSMKSSEQLPHSLPEPRALEPDGRPSATICFSSVLINQPYRHHLTCGHSIEWPDIRKCGKNCELSSVKGAGLKPKSAQHACSDVSCRKMAERRNKTLVQKKKKPAAGTAMPQPRPIMPKLVYVPGLSKEADANRQIKQEEAATDMFDQMQVREPTASTGGTLGRGKAPAPMPQLSSARKRAETIDPEAETHLFNHVMRGLKTRGAERILAKSERVKKSLQIDCNPTLLGTVTPGGRRALRSRHVQEDTDMVDVAKAAVPRELRNLETAGTDKLSYGTATQKAHRFLHDFEDQDAYKAAQAELAKQSKRKGKSRQHTPETYGITIDRGSDFHNFPADQLHSMQKAKAMSQSSDVKMTETHCVCASTPDETLCLCTRCGDYFHPGCVGKGLQPKTAYRGTNAWYLKVRDAEKQRQSLQPFTCESCDEKAAKSRSGPPGGDMTSAHDSATHRAFRRRNPGMSYNDDIRYEQQYQSDLVLFGIGDERAADKAFGAPTGKPDPLSVWESETRASNRKLVTIQDKLISRPAEVAKMIKRQPVPCHINTNLICSFRLCRRPIHGAYYFCTRCFEYEKAGESSVGHERPVCLECIETYQLCHGSTAHRFRIWHAAMDLEDEKTVKRAEKRKVDDEEERMHGREVARPAKMRRGEVDEDAMVE
ncbi:hypothetical protein B0A50_06655 [Salinomyces thailandicus]|uniref:Zinc finger PHD-type domain-containing protein n=1 Tax=Salinomyces thailandicus TaxID=706561 RepID=A0A4U0TQV9_9PEZI|nr:hypothetical protein B0A50_06655 [Salinomyces thailandica]